MNNQNDFSKSLPMAALETAIDIPCDECGNKFFTPVICIKKISALVSPNGKEINAPIQTFSCSKCGHVNKDFMPVVKKE